MVALGFLDDIDYFVFMAGCYIIYCTSYLYMFSIGCSSTPANQHNSANNHCIKVISSSC
jgi:hypothetical protein